MCSFCVARAEDSADDDVPYVAGAGAAAAAAEDAAEHAYERERKRLHTFTIPTRLMQKALLKIPLIGSRAPRITAAKVDVPVASTLAGISAARKAAAIARGDADSMLTVLNETFVRYTSLFSKACKLEYRSFEIRKNYSTTEDLVIVETKERIAEKKRREEEKMAQNKTYRARQLKKRKIAQTKLGSADLKSKEPTVYDL